MKTHRHFAGVVAALLALFLVGSVPVAHASESFDHFEKEIRPVLVNQCYECHSADAKKVKGGLLLDTRAGLLKGGDSGPVIIPGKPAESLLIKAIQYHDEKLQMPPKEKLSDHQVAAFVTWVAQGAPDPRSDQPTGPVAQLTEARKLWSLQPLRKPEPPQVVDSAWPITPVDYFIRAELEKRDLKPVQTADRRNLIRRATFDLIGLPPTPPEIDTFVRDERPLHQAYAAVIDRLLTSPQYGERWGRHWMDLVRYADTAGDNSDYPVPELYRYRNYIIESFNADKPYDQFIREQIAGDLLPAKNQEEKNEKVIATGYVALSRRFGSVIDRYPQHLTIEDTIDNLGRTFLGLTVSCARCHDHKFDAISKEDYYGLYGMFQSTLYPFPGIELDKVPRDFVPLIPQEEYDKLMTAYKSSVSEVDEQIKSKKDEKKKAADADNNEQAETLEKEIKELEKKRNEIKKPKVEMAYAVSDHKPANAKVHLRGEPRSLGEEVPRKFLDLLGGQKLSSEEAKSSGRLQLARWIADRQNPLTARVMVNRIWQKHFGSPLVATPNDFGTRGQPPTHPALLDWLASEFIESGWSIKKMHRLLMLSRVYQLSSEDNEHNLVVDTGNNYYWRFNRQRLDAEQLRDSIMFVAGTLDLSPLDQAHPFPPSEKWGYTQHAPFNDIYPCNRRTVYMMNKRLTALPYFQTFDGADPNANTASRDSSVTTVQALYLMNNDFILDQSRKFAARLVEEKATDSERLSQAFLMTVGRHPSASQAENIERHLAGVREKLKQKGTDNPEETAWASVGAVLFRINEFIYID